MIDSFGQTSKFKMLICLFGAAQSIGETKGKFSFLVSNLTFFFSLTANITKSPALYDPYSVSMKSRAL